MGRKTTFIQALQKLNFRDLLRRAKADGSKIIIKKQSWEDLRIDKEGALLAFEIRKRIHHVITSAETFRGLNKTWKWMCYKISPKK